MALREKMLPCQIREAVITVLSYHSGLMDGYLQHPRLDRKVKIESLSQMVLLLNSLLDMENCPDGPPPLIRPECWNERSIAVLTIQVLFREHYTWQGRLTWQEGKQEYVFHSVIELIQLVDEILAE